MPDQPQKPNRHLTEISHLFLSSIRDQTTNGAPRPQRTPPAAATPTPPAKPAANVSIDLTPEEFARAFGGEDEPVDRGPAPVPQISAVIGAHLNGRQFDRAKEYARHLACAGRRIGLIEVDASEFRVMLFESGEAGQAGSAEALQAECFDPRRMNEVLEELSWDVQQWLLVLPNPRVPEAKNLLREIRRWVLLSTCDHDGVISCYRTLKGMLEMWPADGSYRRPALALSLLDAPGELEAERISAKLTGVCQQFLNWALETEPAVRANHEVAEHLVMCCRPRGDKSQAAAAPQWQIVADFIARSSAAAQASAAPAVSDSGLEPVSETESERPAPAQAKQFIADVIVPSDSAIPCSKDSTMAHSSDDSSGLSAARLKIAGDSEDVIELCGEDGAESSIVEAVLRHCASELVECPIAPPMCPRARLAVGRDRRVVLLAVAREGLGDLSSIGQAYRWLQENHALIGMAVPQLAIDTHQAPHLSLLIDQHDSAAETLQPMLRSGSVTVQTYRKLRWGGKRGLLLQAA
jgi:hypothetical protein